MAGSQGKSASGIQSKKQSVRLIKKDRYPKELTILRNAVARLKASEREYSQTKEVLQKKTHALGERVKELNCLYAISSLVDKHGISLEKILQGVADIIPSAWQYPEITCARIALGGQVCSTANFVETAWKQSANIPVKAKKEGVLSVCYLEERPKCGEGPFLREERSLINAIAKRIGEIIERKNAEDGLRESMARNKALLSAIPDLIFRVDKDGTILDFKSGKDFNIRLRSSALIGKSVHDLPELYNTLTKETVQQGMKNISQVLQTGLTQIYEYRTPQNGAVYQYEVLLTVSGRNEVLGIVRDITERRRLEKQVIEISEWERQRIGQDLHDSLCQQLAGIAYLGKVLQRKMKARSLEESRDAGEIVSLIDEAITQTKGFARGLCPVRLDADGLMMALSALVQNMEKLFGISCAFEYDKPVLFSDNIMATHIYRIVQEAVNNAIKHGKATRIRIRFSDDKGITVLTIKNNGSGFRRASRDNGGMGMSTMRHRANMIGATLDIKNGPDGGTIVVCSFQNRQGEGRA
jgi:signal transduction histidine kinase